jgi:hypothetical protein
MEDILCYPRNQPVLLPKTFGERFLGRLQVKVPEACENVNPRLVQLMNPMPGKGRMGYGIMVQFDDQNPEALCSYQEFIDATKELFDELEKECK